MAMLEIRGVHKSFHTYAKPGVHPGIFGRAPKPTSSLDVLRGVDLTVEKGDVVAILGPSGSGKTTLLRCLNFLETADAGQLTFDGETFDLAHADRASIARLRRKTAFVFQNYDLFRNKTALQNVTEGLIVARRMPKAEADAVGMKMLEKVGLADRADYYPRQLSGGQQQRPRSRLWPRDHLFRRAHQRPRPGIDRRGAGRHAAAGTGGHDHAGRHPRDGLCPQRLVPHRLYGKRRRGRGSTLAGVLCPSQRGKDP